MEFLVIGRYPLSRVRTMPVKYSLLVEWFLPCPVEFNSSLLTGTPIESAIEVRKLVLFPLKSTFHELSNGI